MAYLAMVMFIAIYAFGHQFLDLPEGNNSVQMALFLSFVLGILTGYRSQK
ncbi:MAG: hypothetical protein RIS52_1541 [Pseudomonadota bacterium]|jgi:hypothetical protein